MSSRSGSTTSSRAVRRGGAHQPLGGFEVALLVVGRVELDCGGPHRSSPRLTDQSIWSVLRRDAGPFPRAAPRCAALGLPLPPARMPPLRRGRPLKRWRYVGVYRPDADAVRRRRARRRRAAALVGRGAAGRRAARADDARPGRRRCSSRARAGRERGASRSSSRSRSRRRVEVVSPHGRSWIWTAKQRRRAVRGRVEPRARELRARRRRRLHRRVGRLSRAPHRVALVGRRRPRRRRAPGGWNLVDGVHDAADGERADGVDRRRAARGGAARRSRADLSRRRRARASASGRRARSARDRGYCAQPLPAAVRRVRAASCPGGIRLAEGYGVMEEHEVRW